MMRLFLLLTYLLTSFSKRNSKVANWVASVGAFIIEKLLVWGVGKLWDYFEKLNRHKKIDKAVDDAKDSGDTSDLERILTRR